jgi:hypothetical protein
VLPDEHNPTIVEVTLVNRVTVVKVHQLDEEMLFCGLLTRATVFHHRFKQGDLYVLSRGSAENEAAMNGPMDLERVLTGLFAQRHPACWCDSCSCS